MLASLFGARWIIALGIFFVYAANQIRKYFRLRQFKGPFGTGWSEIPHMKAIIGLHSHLWYKDVTDQYGPLARIGPNDLITSSTELLTQMSAVRSPYTRTAWFYRNGRIEPGRDHILCQVDEEKHTKRRQQMAAGYSGKENTHLELTIDKHISEYIGLIGRKYVSTAAQSKAMDIACKSQYLTLDVISDIGFGQSFGHLTSDSDVASFIESSENAMAYFVFLCATGLRRVTLWPPIARLMGPREGGSSSIGKIMATARRLVDERLKLETSQKTDMLAAFMRHGLTREDLFTEGWVQIMAGSDTTATAIRGTLRYILATPRVYMKLQHEIDQTVASGTFHSEIIPDAVAKHLVYLQAVLWEGLRIRPPVSAISPKRVPQGGQIVVVDGTSVFLPGGTNIGSSVSGINGRKDIFGEDVDVFRPERWIPNEDGTDADRIPEMKRATDLIFGHGKYQCLGKNIAWMEYGKAIFELFRHFDFALAKPQDPWMEKNYIGLFVKAELSVIVTERHIKV